MSFDLREGQFVGLAGQSGCGKSTLGGTARSAPRPDGRRDPVPRRRRHRDGRRPDAVVQEKLSNNISEPLRGAESPVPGRATRLRTAVGPRHRGPGGAGRADRGGAGGRRAAPGRRLPRPTPERTVRRRATARRDRPGARARPGVHRRRRTGVDARRERAHGHPAPVRGAQGDAGPLDAVHLSRPLHDQSPHRPDDDHVPREPRRAGPDRERDLGAVTPVTESLLEAVPTPDPDTARAGTESEDEPPDPIDLPDGCRFHPTCPYDTEECRTSEPPLDEFDEGGHRAACYHPEAVSETVGDPDLDH